MNLIKVCLFILILSPGISKAEIWMYQIQGKQIMDCTKRPEINIDQVWNSLEEITGLTFDIARDTILMPGYILQNQEHKKEFVFYPNKRACDFERIAMVAMFTEDEKKLNQIKSDLNKENRLAVMSPTDIPANYRQDWVNAFAGCTNGVLQSQTPLKGFLQDTINRCDCVARRIMKLEGIDISKEENVDIMTDILESCS